MSNSDASHETLGKVPALVRWRRRFIFVVVQLAIAFVLLEIGARIFDPLGISYYPETARFFDTMIHEEPIGYRLRPGMDADFNNARYQTNSFGLRGPEISTEKPANERRIAFLGDSFVFGIGVNNDQTIPAALEGEFGARGDGSRVRVVNMGVPSYNTEQELIQFETLGLGLVPDAVLLIFSPNDIEPKKWVFEKRESFLADIAQRSYALSLMYVAIRMVRSKFGAREQTVNVQNFEPGNPRFQAIIDSLKRIKRLCDERSLPFVVYVLGSTDDPPNDLIAKAGKDFSLDVFGLEPQSDPRWAGIDPAKFRNSIVDAHCNKAGCEMWSRIIYQDLQRRGILTAR